MNFFQRLSHTGKFLLIMLLAVLLLIPQLLVWSLIRERERYSEEATEGVSDSWGKKQTISAPYCLFLPHDTFVNKSSSRVSSRSRDRDSDMEDFFYLFPDSISVDTRVRTELRHRGIFPSLLYVTEVTVRGTFPPLTGSLLEGLALEKEFLNNCWLIIGMSDPLGLNSSIYLQSDSEHSKVEFTPFLLQNSRSDIATFGCKASALPEWRNIDSAAWHFSYSYELRGSEALYFAGGAKVMEVSFLSDWEEVSFEGRRLPEEHEVGDSSSRAFWRVYNANTGIPQSGTHRQVEKFMSLLKSETNFYHSAQSLESGLFGVRFLPKFHVYKDVDRTVKYAILIIVLTFLMLFFLDILKKLDFPLILYILTGLALVLFYVLLLSLAEVVGFSWAFLISSLAIVGMITVYIYGFSRNVRNSLVVMITISVLYGMLYCILHWVSFPLLLGSIILFFILGFIMYLSLRLDW